MVQSVALPIVPPVADAVEPGPEVPRPGRWAAEPILPGERILSLDVLRGVAIGGILFANIMLMAGVAVVPRTIRVDVADGTIATLERIFVDGCFYPLFAFLFGVGFFLVMRRFEARGGKLLWFWPRRMLVLLLIAVAHWLFLWNAFILLQFAVLGLLLPLFRRRSAGLIVATAALCFGLQVYSAPLSRAADHALVTAPAVQRYLVGHQEEYSGWRARQAEVLRHGSYPAVVSMRLTDLVRTHSEPRRYYPWVYGEIFAMLLLGMLAGRGGLFVDPDKHGRILRTVLLVCVPFGIAAKVFRIVLYDFTQPLLSLHKWLAVDGLWRLGGIALGAGYAAVILLLLRGVAWRERLSPFAAVGRMALSNYLLQSLLGTAVFYGYGLGLYGRVGTLGALGAALTIIAVQIPLSVWWTQHYRFGPAEWLWRSLTYMSRQPMRIATAARVPPTPEAAAQVARVEALLP